MDLRRLCEADRLQCFQRDQWKINNSARYCVVVPSARCLPCLADHRIIFALRPMTQRRGAPVNMHEKAARRAISKCETAIRSSDGAQVFLGSVYSNRHARQREV